MAKKKISLVEANARIEHAKSRVENAKFQVEEAKAILDVVNKDLETLLDPELVLAEVSTDHVVWTLGYPWRNTSERNKYTFLAKFQLFEVCLYPSGSDRVTYRPTLRVTSPINKIPYLVTNGPQVTKIYEFVQRKMKKNIRHKEWEM